MDVVYPFLLPVRHDFEETWETKVFEANTSHIGRIVSKLPDRHLPYGGGTVKHYKMTLSRDKFEKWAVVKVFTYVVGSSAGDVLHGENLFWQPKRNGDKWIRCVPRTLYHRDVANPDNQNEIASFQIFVAWDYSLRDVVKTMKHPSKTDIDRVYAAIFLACLGLDAFYQLFEKEKRFFKALWDDDIVLDAIVFKQFNSGPMYRDDIMFIDYTGLDEADEASDPTPEAQEKRHSDFSNACIAFLDRVCVLVFPEEKIDPGKADVSDRTVFKNMMYSYIINTNKTAKGNWSFGDRGTVGYFINTINEPFIKFVWDENLALPWQPGFSNTMKSWRATQNNEAS